MPVLDVGEWSQDGKLNPTAPILLLGRMLFPSDQERYEEFVDETLEKASREQRNVADPLYRALDPFKYLREKKPNQRGLAAGAVLATVRIIVEKYPEHDASLNKAFAVLEDEFKRKRQNRRDAPPANKRGLQKAWKDFQSVSSLWAATWLFANEMGSLEEVTEALSTPNALPVFLATAENMRDFGEAFQLPKTKNRLLSAETMWRIPKDLPLPQVEVSLPPLSRRAKQALDAYRAPV